LWMCLLPTPFDPIEPDYAHQMAFPFGTAGGHMLGTDETGHDTRSRLMSGGRFLLFRLGIVGLLLTGAGLLLRRRTLQRGGRAWPGIAGLIWLVAVGTALSTVIELIIAIMGAPRWLTILGPVGRILVGVPAAPPAATWGGMLADGAHYVVQAPWLPLFP